MTPSDLGSVSGPQTIRGWLDDIENALRGIFTSSSDEDEAFDNATRSLDALREYLGYEEEPSPTAPEGPMSI